MTVWEIARWVAFAILLAFGFMMLLQGDVCTISVVLPMGGWLVVDSINRGGRDESEPKR